MVNNKDMYQGQGYYINGKGSGCNIKVSSYDNKGCWLSNQVFLNNLVDEHWNHNGMQHYNSSLYDRIILEIQIRDAHA